MRQRVTDDGFTVTYDPKKGALVDLPTECPLCRVWVGPSYDVHMIMAHPETRPHYAERQAEAAAAKPKKKRR